MKESHLKTHVWQKSRAALKSISFRFLVISSLFSIALFSFTFRSLIEANNTLDNQNEAKVLVAPCTNGNLGGTVFNDFNANGINDTEPGVNNLTVRIFGLDAGGDEMMIQSVTSDVNGEYSFTDPSITFSSNESYRIEFSDWPEFYSPSLKGNSNNGSTIVVNALSCDNNFALVEVDSYCQDNPFVITSCYVEGDQGATSGDVLVAWPYNIIPEADEEDDINNILHESLSGQIGTTFGLAYHKRSNQLFAGAHMKRFAGFAPGSDPASIFIIDNPSDNNTSGSEFLSLEEYFGANVAGSDIHDFSLVDVNPSPVITQNEVLDPLAFDAVGKYALGDIELNTAQDTLYVVNLFDRNIYAISIGSDPENPVKPVNASEIGIISLTDPSLFSQITASVATDELRPFALKYYRQRLYIGMVGSGQSGGDLVALVFEYNPTDASLTKVLESSLVYARGCAFGFNNGSISICAGPADWNPWVSSWPQNTGGGPQDAAAVNINFINATTILALEEGHPQPMLTDIEFDASGNMILALRDRVGDQCGTNAPYPGGEQVRLPNGNYVFTDNAGSFQNSPNPAAPPGFVNLYITNQDAFGDLLRATKSGSTYTLNVSEFTDNTTNLPNSQMTFDNCVPGETVFNGDCYNDGLFVHEETSMGGLTVLLHQNTLIAPAMDPRSNAFSNGIDWFDLDGLTSKVKSITILTGANSPFGKAYGLGEMELQCFLPPIQFGDYVWSDVNADGIQNPNEDGIEGVNVNLYNSSKDPIGNTSTDSDGYYLFDNSNTTEDIEPEETYFIVFGESQYDSGTGILTISGSEQFLLTTDSLGTGSQPNNNDSDIESMVSMFSGVPFTSLLSPEYGADHSIDAGFIPKPIVTIIDVDILCGPISAGGSISVNVEGGVEPYTYDWSEDAYDGMTNIMNVPLGSYSLTVTDGTGCEVIANTEITDEPCPPNPCMSGETGGTVFYDPNANGIDEGEGGVETVTVQIFACNAQGVNELIETVYTDVNGDYHFTDPTIDFAGGTVYQIVFSNLPEGYISSSIGSDNGTDVQYITEVGCDYDYGILHPDLACAKPDFESSVVVGDELFSSGTLLGPGIALITCGTIIDLPSDERHTVGLMDIKGITTAADRPEVNPNGWYHPSWNVDNIGNVFGIDYDTSGNIYVTASSHYSHIYGYVLGPDASNYTQAIIKYGNLGGGENDIEAAGTVYKLDAVTGVASVFAQLPQQAFAFSHYACESVDPPLARNTGPGLGNIVFDQANNQFFVSNFEDGKIYRLNTDGDTINSFDPQTLGVFAADDGSNGWAPDAKPYGLAVNKDGSELYFGTHELNTAPGLYSVSLDGSGDFDGTETFHAIYSAEGDIGYLFAVEPGWVSISDLEFLPNGQIMVGLRTGCAGQYATSHNHGATFYIADEEGDGIFDNIVSNTDIQYPNDGTENDDGYGGIGIWDKHDGTYDFLVSSSDTRAEVGPHGMILFPHNFTNGNPGFSLQPSAAIPYLPSFNVQDFKGIGGDVEVFSPCGEPAFHVGNFAWIDTNGDGVQDACESPLANLTVKLYTKPNSGNPELMATTVTNETGEYYFSDSTNVDQNWESNFANIEKDSSYYIVFCGDSYNPDGEIVAVDGILFSTTSPNSEMTLGGDMTDSDISNITVPGEGEFPGICITVGETDFTFDAGFVPKPDLALIQVLDPDFDVSDLKFGDSVKFKITVFNQSLGSFDSLEITDYIPAGFTFDEMLIGNEMWSSDGSNAKAIMTSGLAPGAKDSICIYLTLEKTDNPQEWVNVAEISDAWSDGESIEDCDSELNDDPNDNGGSEINTEADDEIFGDGTATEPGGDPDTDQDNVDPATVPICDLALINTIVEIPSSLKLGDTIKYAVIVENQGTVPATNIEIDYTIPNGLIYLDSNDDLLPNWSEGTGDATANIVDELGIGEKDTICIYLSVSNVPTDELTSESWTTFAEIASFEDPNAPGEDKSDFDSVPDGDPTNDPGGNPEDDTNDVTTGDGTGDPEDPNEDSDPLLDEDDHDPAIIYVCDAATLIYTDHDESILYNDTIKFNVVVFNQGNGPITNVDLNDFIGDGLEFVSTTINDTEGWTSVDSQLSTTITEIIEPGESDTTCLELIVRDLIPYDEDAYLQVVEIEEFEDPAVPGESKVDIDSTPDNDPENDSGGNPEDETDNEVDGDGSGDPEDPNEDSNPELDEDDNDPVLLSIFDLALDKVVQEDKTYSPGEMPIFEIAVHNQGNVAVDNYKVVDYLRSGFTFSTTNNPGWNEMGGNLIYTSSAPLEPGETYTITLELTVVIPATPMGVSDWWNYAEIMEADEDSNPNNPDTIDADSNPNDNSTDDNDVEPNDGDDNVINENGNEGGDEDDHDPAMVIVGYDLALRKTVAPEGPYSYGDTLTYTITIFNQGGLSVSNIAIYDSIPCGLEYLDAINDWDIDGDIATTTLEDVLNPGSMITKEIKLLVQKCDEPAYDNYINIAEISDFLDENGDEPTSEDIDSTPDDDPNNDGDPIDNEVDDPMDQDDQDIENIEICDLALINTIVDIPETIKIKDTVKYEVIVFNQGNADVNSASINYNIPNGLSYLPVNSSLSPMWVPENDEVVNVDTDKVLGPGDSDTICLYLQIENVATEAVSEDSWTTVAEISSFENDENETKTTDADSTSDDDPTNDPGGNPDDETDDEIDGDGTGDPNDPIEDMNPEMDEDDHDPAIINVCDVATIVDTEDEGPFSYGDTIKYFVEVHNQGNGPITNIAIQNFFGEGLSFVNSTENTTAGWVEENKGELSLLIIETLDAGEIDTICLYMEVIPDYESSEDSWIQNVEVVSFEDPDDLGTPKSDIDSTPDDDPDNDPGGNPNDEETDDVTDGDGSGDPNDPDENTDPDLDEDDQDVEDIEICDIALINTIVDMNDPPRIGDTVKYEVIVVNQGNAGANSVDLDYAVPNGLTFLPLNTSLDPSWTEESMTLLSSTTAALAPGESDTLCLYLQLENLPTGEVTEDSWTTIAEITEYIDEDGEPKTIDVDSTPDDDPTNDPGGNPGDETDDELEGDGTGDPNDPVEDMNPDLDEDDHDPAIIYVCDVATIIDTEDEGPFSYGDTIKYFVEVHNQGNGPITNIAIQNLFGEGLSFVNNTENTTAGWVEENKGELSLLISETLDAGEIDTICLYMEVIPDYESSEDSWLQNVEVVSFEDPDDLGTPKSDIDSTPDDDPDNDPGGNPNDEETDDVTDGDGSGDPNDPDENTDPDIDEDDQDVEDIEICDIALINTIVDVNDPPRIGDTVKYEVIVVNQGNVGANSVDLDYAVPNGLTFLPLNTSLDPSWTEESMTLLSSTTAALAPGESDTLCLYLQLENLPTGEVTEDSWTTIAEITEYTDEDGEPKTIDVDSTPDDDPTNDPGGNPGDETDDELEGDGTGDPNDPVEDMDPDLDEDDHDPAIIYVCDVATIVDTENEGPFSYGDTIKYFVEVHNQGNGPITNIAIQNFFGEGLSFVNSTENTTAGWVEENKGELSLLIIETLDAGEIDTICLYMEVIPDYESSEDSWIQNVEVVSFEDPDDLGTPKSDIDSTPDDDPDNDPGGNPNDEETDDVTDGDGSGDPNDPDENTDPDLDEDDQDVEDIEICDIALINTIADVNDPPRIGDTVKYEVVVVNQGNVGANSVDLDYAVPNGLTFLPINTSLDPSWTEESMTLLSSTTAALAPGESDTLCLYLQLENLPTGEVTKDSWTTIAEITEYTDEDGEPKTIDVDSTPDDDPTNDPGGNPGDETDDELEGDGTGDPNDPVEDMDPDLDEDDHDPAIVYVCDVATIVDTEDEGPFSYGDTIKYFVEVHNQGNGPITNVAIQNLFGEGLSFVNNTENTTAGWVEENKGELSLLINETLDAGEIDTICLYMEVIPDYESSEDSWLQNVEVVSFEDPDDLGTPKSDIDSTPDNDPDNDPGGNPNDEETDDVTDGDGSGDPNDPDENTDPDLDEDDQDVEDIEICDIALINTIADVNDPPRIGDTVKYEVVVVNQGNVGANSVDLDYAVPNGLTFLPINTSLDPSWTEESMTLLSSTTAALAPGESDTLCLYLQLENLPTGEVTKDSWTTIAEITEYTDEDGEPKTIDVDSTPDDDPTNDPGGNPGDETDDELEGDGTGDPNDPVEDMDPDLDEDDNDPAIIHVCDVAMIVYTEMPDEVNYYDTLQYFVVVANQGNGDITNIQLADHLPEGLEFITTPSNEEEGWEESEEIDDAVDIIYDGILMTGGMDTICLELELVPIHDGSNEFSWMQTVEVVEFEDPEDVGTSKNDIDSTPDDDPDNDPGGNPDDDTDNATDGDGSGDPNDPNEDSDPEQDEDDHDAVDTKVFDLALIMQIDSMPPVLPVVPGDVVKFIVVVTNQGNTPANNIEITNYLMDENLVLAGTKENDDWDSIDSETNQYTIDEELAPGEKDTVCIYLEIIGGAMTDIVTYSEISGSTETDGACYDIDSTPDDILEDDAGGTPQTNEDDHIEDDGEDGNEDDITDEDDHDPAMLDAQDLALIIWADQKEPVLEGQDVKFIIRVTNQGNITNENIEIVNYLPEGFELSDNDDNGWEYDEMNDDQVTKTLTDPLAMGEVVETCIILTVQEGVSATDLINYAEIVSSNSPEGLDLTNLDVDSSPNNIDDDDTGGQYEDMPDCSTEPIVINDDNYDEGAGVNGEDEDDHDPAWVHVFDLATIVYTDHTTPIIPGDEIKFNVEVHNQGNMSATDIDLMVHMPEGFTLSENDDNDWDIQDGLLVGTYDDALIPEQVDTVCLLLEVLPDFTLVDLVPIVEITGAMDTLGNVRDDSDLDSDPNESVDDDEGGEIFTESDDELEGNGEVDDDEDDHDPAVPPVMDLAIKIITVDEEPKQPGDIVKFSIMVYNQGSMIPSEFTIENYVPDGLIFIQNSDNNGWLPSGVSNATYAYDKELLPLTSDTLCIFLEVAPGANPMNVVDMVEIIQIIDQMGNDVSLLDIDSESDNSNENDLGNDLYSEEDNKIDENGRSGEDEDDHDQAFVNMCQSISCNGHMNISVDQNCEAVIAPSVVLTGDIFPDHIYEVEITNSDGEVVSNMFTGDDIGELFTVSVSNPLCDDISCWMTVLIEDKWAPQIICQNDTLSCAMAFDDSTRPTIIDDNCSGGELILLDEVVESFSCDTIFTSKLTRVWVAKDEAGNMSEECTQEIFLLRTNLDSIMPVQNFMLATNNAINCSSGYEVDANGHPAPSLTGVPQLRLGDGSFIDLYPFEAKVICNGFVEYKDEVLPGSTSCVTKILRTWIVGEWWCSQTNQREFIQIIEIVDFDGPSVSCPSDLTVSTSGFGCESYASMELPVVSDACNDEIRIDLSTPSGFYSNYSGEVIMLPAGVHELTYHNYDGCNNRTDCSFYVTVRDDADPIAICDQFTAVGIGLDGLTKVTAEAIDDGSFDECGPVSLKVARMDSPGFDDLLGFESYVDITCADVGENVMVGLLVTDTGGNTNMCMVSIEIQDKVDAKFTCPEDMVVECNFPYDPSNLGAFFGEVEIYDNCPGSNTVIDTLLGNLNSCGAGVLIRELRLLNALGEQVDYCTQQIIFESGTPLQYSDITPPISEVTVSGCGVESIDPSILGMPIVEDGFCQQTAIGIENDTFPFTENGACLKIIRTFKVIDWCIDDGPGSVLEPFEFNQIIKVNNTVGPEIEDVFADSIFCSYEIGCGAININGYLTATSTDDCTVASDLLNRYEVRNSDGEIVRFGSGLDASGEYDVDTYTVRFYSEDKCGNEVFEESTFEVRSCKLPTPYCLQGLSTTLTAMDTLGDGTPDVEMVMLPAEFFDAGSYHPCGYDVQLSFSEDVNDTIMTFFCSDTVGLQPIELWVTDEHGGQDYCTTFVDIQDNDTIDLCGGLKPVDIAGRIYTESDAELKDAEVELRSAESLLTMTDENGIYEFANMPQGGDYQIVPIKDNDYMNGVSTLDLVIIQRHILGLAPLNSVYERIAADINNNEKITASDLIALRKMILGIDVSFPNNTSWRFIDSEHEFLNEENPWESPMPEKYNIEALSEDMQIDFIAVKTGDVNGNVDMNVSAGVVSETRSHNTLTLELPDIEVEKENLYEIDVRGSDELNIYGMQYSLDVKGLEIVGVKPGKMDMRKENTSTDNDMLHVSYASGEGDEVIPEDKLYSIIVKAKSSGQLSDMIGISSDGLDAEFYEGEGLKTGVIEIEWRDEVTSNLIEMLSLEGNSPNPWRSSTEIVFHMPRDGEIRLSVTDVSGRILWSKVGEYESGIQQIALTGREIKKGGVLLYELQFEDQVVNGKMIRIE